MNSPFYAFIVVCGKTSQSQRELQLTGIRSDMYNPRIRKPEKECSGVNDIFRSICACQREKGRNLTQS